MDAGFDRVTVSPKVGMPGGRHIQTAAILAADEVKWVVGKARDLEELVDFLAQHWPSDGTAVLPHIAVQPLSQNPKATTLCVEAALSRGYRLSLQAHKFAGLA